MDRALEQCKDVHTERNRAENTLKRRHNETNLIEFRRMNALCRKTFKTAKRDCWKEYVSTLNENSTMKEVWTKVSKIRGKYSTHPPPLLKTDAGELTDDPATTSELFAEAFASVSRESGYSPDFIKLKREKEKRPINFKNNENLHHFHFDEPFSIDELLYALGSTSETNPGLDEVSCLMIKKSHSNLIKCLLNLYNRIYAEDLFPDSWRTAAIIPIPKPNKDTSEPLNYRQISYQLLMQTAREDG